MNTPRTDKRLAEWREAVEKNHCMHDPSNFEFCRQLEAKLENAIRIAKALSEELEKCERILDSEYPKSDERHPIPSGVVCLRLYANHMIKNLEVV